MRGTPFNAAYDNYLFTYSELSASLADGTFLQNNAGCPNTNNCVPAISASYYGQFATLGMPSNSLPTWGQVYAKRVASSSTSTLTMGYEGSEFTATLSNPLSVNLDISLVTAYGYIFTDCRDESPSEVHIVDYVRLSPGQTYQTKYGNTDFPPSAVRYNIANSITINGTAKSHGDTIVVGGTTITVAIPYASCSPYAF